MKDRETAAVGALRTALGAIDNADAVPSPDGPATAPTTGPIAGATDGAGAGDVARRELSEADVTAIVHAEIDDLRSSADEYDALGETSRRRNSACRPTSSSATSRPTRTRRPECSGPDAAGVTARAGSRPTTRKSRP